MGRNFELAVTKITNLEFGKMVQAAADKLGKNAESINSLNVFIMGSVWLIVLLGIFVFTGIYGFSELVEYQCKYLLAFKVSTEKSGVMLLCLPLYLTCNLLLHLLIFFLCSVYLVLWLLCGERIFFSGPIYLVFCRLLVCLWISFSLG